MPTKNTTPERWLPVVGYEGAYDVSSYGRIRSLLNGDARGTFKRDTPLILAQQTVAYGYMRLGIYKDGIQVFFTTHTLVLLAFVGPRPKGMQAAHWDGDPANNRLENLRWTTARENCGDKDRHGTSPIGERNPKARLSVADVVEIRRLNMEDGMTHTAIGRQFGVCRSNISGIIHRRNWKHIP